VPPARRPLSALALALTLTLILTPATSSVGRGPGASALRAATGEPTSIVLILMENKGYGAVIGNANAPYLNEHLIPRGTLYTDSHAAFHPSLPNYLALTAGSNRGCLSDSCAADIGGANLFRQLSDAGIGWRAWAASIPWPCARVTGGLYAMRHVPAVYYANVAGDTCRNRVVAYPSTLPDHLPRFVFATPNLCQDMHDCGVARGDQWLAGHVPALLRHGATVIVTFDETEGSSTRIATVVAGRGIGWGVRDDHRLTHFGVLAGIEEHFGLWRLRRAADARPLGL
jgi:phosphatidylinositol-3-phosphatase